MYNILSIIIALLFLFTYEIHGIFEYICEEKQLFKPYIHVYRGRKGERVLESGPGFHVMIQEKDIYVCINGPAYLYFAKTTELGQVYEAPQSHVYSHTCEMYNVKPHSKATKVDFELHLMAVLLYGDPHDYRLPCLQRFTAPYFFAEDEYLTLPKHYQNATSVAIIGETECTLEKGDKEPKIPIKIHSKVPDYVAPTPAPPAGTKPEYDQYLCRLGFSKLKDKAKSGTDEEKEQMRVMVNDEPMRVVHCDEPYTFSKSKIESKTAALQTRADKVEVDWVSGTTKTEKQDEFKKKVEAAIEPWTTEITDIEAKIAATPPPSAEEKTKLEAKKKKLEDKKKVEEDKMTPFNEITEKADTAAGEVKLPADIDTKTAAAEDKANELETAKDDLKKAQEADPIVPADVTAAQDKVYEAERAAFTAAKEVQAEITKWEIIIAKAELLLKKVENHMSAYKTGGGSASAKKKIAYEDRTTPQVFEIDGVADTTLCEKLPRLTGEEGECAKGKPTKDQACGLFKVTLGRTTQWEDPAAAGTPSKDAWKKDVMELAGDIFINACPYLPNRRKFVKRVNLVMGHYLTSDDYYFKPAGAGTSNACSAFNAWKLDPFDPKIKPPTPDQKANKEQRDFWKTIIEALTECKKENRILMFKDKSPTYGRWIWVKPGKPNKTEEEGGNANDENGGGESGGKEMNIEPYTEQAEKEFVFNWVIDMFWRIFGTALGMCMPGYEAKVPLISSRFYSLFTEDFLIPLRETWVNPKDNLIFQWILGEFYNGDAENWAELCMEASYFYSEREDYRPLRSLLVNCASEHNYFTSGKFVGFTGRYVGSSGR